MIQTSELSQTVVSRPATANSIAEYVLEIQNFRPHSKLTKPEIVG